MHRPRSSSVDDVAQKLALQRRVATLCMSATFAVAVIDFRVWYVGRDIWKLSIAVCMAVLASLLAVALVLQWRGRHGTSLGFLLSSTPLAITWIMTSGGAATIIPTLIAALAMMLLIPDTLGTGIISPRRWMAVLVASYLAGIGLRLVFRGLDFAASPAELAIVVFVPGTLIFVQWLLIQRVFGDLRVALAESEALRRDHEQRNRELIASQQALERASTAKSQFLANMSHELRTPLSIILGYAEILEEELTDAPAPGRTWGADLAKIRAAGTHLLSLISDVLDLSKIEAGKTDLFPEPFSLLALAHEVADACQPLIQRRHNTLRLELHPQTDELHTDRMKLRQILLNLLSNAAKFTDAGQVTLRTHVGAHGHVLIEVQDTGLGIDEEAQTRIFDAFEQADGSTTRTHGGTGLGLTLVRRFARLLGGDVTLDSKPGHGALFRVLIPRRAPLQEPAAER